MSEFPHKRFLAVFNYALMRPPENRLDRIRQFSGSEERTQVKQKCEWRCAQLAGRRKRYSRGSSHSQEQLDNLVPHLLKQCSKVVYISDLSTDDFDRNARSVWQLQVRHAYE
jgi:hypothetical protein